MVTNVIDAQVVASGYIGAARVGVYTRNEGDSRSLLDNLLDQVESPPYRIEREG